MKNLTASAKTLIMTIITMIATSISMGQFPPASWAVFGITVLGTVLCYIAKNAVFPSISLLGTVDLRDLASGAFMAVGAALSNWAATAVVGTPIDWHSLLLLCGSVFVGYLAKNFATKNPTP